MNILVLGLCLFLGVHSIAIAAPAWRSRMRERLGEGGWKALYGAVALIGFVLIVRGFEIARAAPVVLYTPPPWMRHVTFLFMVPVFPLLLSAYLPGHIKAAVKHPMLAAVKFWAVAHLLMNGRLADVLLFGGFLAWAVVDRISLKRRPVAPSSRRGAPSAWYDAAAIVLGLGLYGFFVAWAHLRLFGVSPLG
ncbi:MAG: NnrU family protein [Gammaproteobacteria bacterium]|nr:NnrU family protein [Gammaproteobacteria bacterium]MDE2349193.1 NnrU family protein [Gammaproteobacteria bacterium]